MNGPSRKRPLPHLQLPNINKRSCLLSFMGLCTLILFTGQLLRLASFEEQQRDHDIDLHLRQKFQTSKNGSHTTSAADDEEEETISGRTVSPPKRNNVLETLQRADDNSADHSSNGDETTTNGLESSHDDSNHTENNSERIQLHSFITPARAPWRDSKVLPKWMKLYFQWHQDARRRMNSSASAWREYNYLVVRCLTHDKVCGGGADRLKSLPFMILLAHKTQRLLFYHWERPAPLSAFLVPPADAGMDWQWPPHPDLANHTFDRTPHIETGRMVNALVGYRPDDLSPHQFAKMQKRMGPSSLPQVASIRYHSHLHGRLQYDGLRLLPSNNATSGDDPDDWTATGVNVSFSYMDIFQDAWNSVFVPSPGVAQRIQQRQAQLGLVPNQYHAIHIRSRYNAKGKKDVTAAEMADIIQGKAVRSIDCLHHLIVTTTNRTNSTVLLPWSNATPIFIAADGRQAIRATTAYARQRGLTHLISTADDATPTLHLDRGSIFTRLERTNTSASVQEQVQAAHAPWEYYDTFADVYLLAGAQCTVFGLGNYGRWANLLSRDWSCHFDTDWHHRNVACPWDEQAAPEEASDKHK